MGCEKSVVVSGAVTDAVSVFAEGYTGHDDGGVIGGRKGSEGFGDGDAEGAVFEGVFGA